MLHAAAGGMSATLWLGNPARYPGTGTASVHSMPGHSCGSNELSANKRPQKLGQQLRLAYQCLKLFTRLPP